MAAAPLVCILLLALGAWLDLAHQVPGLDPFSKQKRQRLLAAVQVLLLLLVLEAVVAGQGVVVLGLKQGSYKRVQRLQVLGRELAGAPYLAHVAGSHLPGAAVAAVLLLLLLLVVHLCHPGR